MKKFCSVCKNEKDIDLFYKRKSSKDLHSNQCMACKKEINKKYYEDNSDILKPYQKEYRKNNRKKINEYFVNRRKKDNLFRLRYYFSNQFRDFIRGNKKKDIIKYLDYNFDQLRFHIENQFHSGMSWDNYGIYWSIDHIIAQSYYNYLDEEDIKKCWNLRNLRPLLIEENISKNNKMYYKLIDRYKIWDLLPKDIINGLKYKNYE
jgi:hypothetical protein